MQVSRNWLALFGIEPGEGKPVFLFVAFSFFLGVANNFSQTAAFTLFLARYSAQQLSYIYIINAIIVTVLTALYLRLGRRLAFQKLLVANLAFLVVLGSLFWAGLQLHGAWAIFLMPVAFQVVINFGIMAFWPLANRLFTVRQGKRLFGLIGSGQWIAIVVTGFLMGPLSSAIGTQNLMGLALVGVAGALGFVWVITRTYRTAISSQSAQPAAAEVQSSNAKLSSIWRDRYVLLIFGLIAAWWIGFFLIDNLFYGRAAAQYPDPSQLAGFLGKMFSTIGVLTLLMNFVLAGRIISRYGMRISLLLLPSTLVAVALALAVSGLAGGGAVALFWMTIGAKLADTTVGFSVDRSLQTLLYQPFQADRRAQIQTIAEGAVQPFGNGLAGVILLGLGALFKIVTLPLIFAMLAVSLAWVAIAYVVGKEYPRKLVEAISRRRLDLSAINFTDASTIQALRNVLSDPHSGPVIYATACLEDANRQMLLQAIPDLLRHVSPDVRQNTYERIERLKLGEALPQLRKSLETETFAEPRRAGIRALFSFSEAEDLARSTYYLNHPASEVRLGVIVGMIRAGGAERAFKAGERLLELAHSRQADERVQACQAIGEIGSERYSQLLEGLLQDPEVQVRLEALRAVGQIKSAALWPQVITALEDWQVRGTAARALAEGGSSALPDIRRALDQTNLAPVVRRQLIMVCGRIRTPEARQLLRSKLSTPDLETRGQVLNSLRWSGYHRQPEETSQFTGLIREEARFSAWLIAGALDLDGHEPYQLVSSALQYELANSRERIFDLLACLALERQNLLQARQALNDPSPERRAYALEIIDTQLPQELKPVLIPLLDEESPDQRLKSLAAHFPHRSMDPEQRLEEIACRSLDWNTAWLAATAFFVASRLHSAWLGNVNGQIKEIESVLVHNLQPWARSRPDGPTIARSGMAGKGETMYSLIEKVLILKKSSLFSETPDDALAEVAQTLKEVSYSARQLIIEKGAPGNSMFLIASGKVRVFDGGRTINYLQEGDVFGEMAVLDPAPRSASVEAVTDTDLLQMDQIQLFELVESRQEVARGVIQVLSHHLRNRLHDLDRLQNVQERPMRS